LSDQSLFYIFVLLCSQCVPLPNDKHYTTTALAISFKQALKEVNLPETYSIQSSRHTYATTLLAKTSNLRFVQKQLGHASINMSALYADVLPEQNQSLANAILD
jgi:site-specific recombinase XerD